MLSVAIWTTNEPKKFPIDIFLSCQNEFVWLGRAGAERSGEEPSGLDKNKQEIDFLLNLAETLALNLKLSLLIQRTRFEHQAGPKPKTHLIKLSLKQDSEKRARPFNSITYRSMEWIPRM